MRASDPERVARSLTRAPRTVVAYHGCSAETADAAVLADGGRFTPSRKEWDWLGEGVYFFEYAPYRAREWARQKADEPTVLEATVRLGRCLNLLDIEHTGGLREAYTIVRGRYEDAATERLPRNTGGGAHFLDRAVLDYYCRLVEQVTALPYQTVRGSFPEGEALFPGSKILTRAHVQIAVRDPDCITRLRRVDF